MNRIFKFAFSHLNGVKVYALVGRSGTGKSHHSKLVFDDDAHREEVIEALLKEKYKKILIIGTSEKMVNKIAQRLNLPPVTKVFHIEEVASEEEIETAMRIRYTEGKHVIPVPSIEITRDCL